ncbi:MAG: methyltransferase family protein [Acidimicrobiales bacterium]
MVVFVVRSIVQKRATGDSGIRPGAFADDASGIERAAYLLLVVAFAGAIAAPVAAMAGLDPLTGSDVVRIGGLVIAVVGIGVTYLAQVGMGSEWRIGIDRTEATGLVTDGVFSLVRNPIFTAMIFTAAGFAAMVPNVIAVVAAICLVVAIELQVRYVEEPHLQRLHGNAYHDYAAQVGRFIPVLGRIDETEQR